MRAIVRRTRLRALLGGALAILLVPASLHAHGLDGLIVGGIIVNLLPAGVGTEVSTAPNANPAFILAWTSQLPIDPGAHRLVLDPQLVFGSERPTTFRLRVGYRLMPMEIHGKRQGQWVRPFIGLGSTVMFSPRVRPSASLEAGMKFGEDFGGTFTVRGDLWSDGVAVSALVGWSFF